MPNLVFRSKRRLTSRAFSICSGVRFALDLLVAAAEQERQRDVKPRLRSLRRPNSDVGKFCRHTLHGRVVKPIDLDPRVRPRCPIPSNAPRCRALFRQGLARCSTLCAPQRTRPTDLRPRPPTRKCGSHQDQRWALQSARTQDAQPYGDGITTVPKPSFSDLSWIWGGLIQVVARQTCAGCSARWARTSQVRAA